MENLKEFTLQEYNDFISTNEHESFNERQIKSFLKETIEKSKKDSCDFEIACASADFDSLNKVVVVNEDLSKSIMYWRESQTEPVDNIDGIFKSIDNRIHRRFKNSPLNILKGIAGVNCADDEAIMKARISEPLGATKIWNGKVYVKTAKGWRPKGKVEGGDNNEKKD